MCVSSGGEEEAGGGGGARAPARAAAAAAAERRRQPAEPGAERDLGGEHADAAWRVDADGRNGLLPVALRAAVSDLPAPDAEKAAPGNA